MKKEVFIACVECDRIFLIASENQTIPCVNCVISGVKKLIRFHVGSESGFGALGSGNEV